MILNFRERRFPILVQFLIIRELKKTKISTLIQLLIVSILFSSCIDIVEELTIHSNRSGTLSYRIETSGPGNFLNELSSLFSASVEDQIKIEANKFIQGLKKQDGITNLQYNLTGGAGTYYLTFDFKDYKSLNKSLYAIGGARKTIFSPGYIKIGKSKFKKLNFTPWLNRYLKQEEIEFQSPFITDNISFVSIVNVPSDITGSRPADNNLHISPRKIRQEFRLTNILEGDANTSLKIRY